MCANQSIAFSTPNSPLIMHTELALQEAAVVPATLIGAVKHQRIQIMEYCTDAHSEGNNKTTPRLHAACEEIYNFEGSEAIHLMTYRSTAGLVRAWSYISGLSTEMRKS